jgi:hypothetical protein
MRCAHMLIRFVAHTLEFRPIQMQSVCKQIYGILLTLGALFMFSSSFNRSISKYNTIEEYQILINVKRQMFWLRNSIVSCTA